MAWLEQKPTGKLHVVFRFSGQRIKKSLGTSNSQVAQAGLLRLEENLSLIKRGRLKVPEDADIAVFLLFDGQLNGKSHRLPKLRTFKHFRIAFLGSIPEGSLEDSTRRHAYSPRPLVSHSGRFLLAPSTVTRRLTAIRRYSGYRKGYSRKAAKSGYNQEGTYDAPHIVELGTQ